MLIINFLTFKKVLTKITLIGVITNIEKYKVSPRQLYIVDISPSVVREEY